jgi:hypothetical protein
MGALALVTWAFAAIWSSDQQTQAAYVLARRDAARALSTSEAVSHAPSQHPSQRGGPDDSTLARLERCRTGLVGMTLPTGIAPGPYRVVDSRGRSELIVVPAPGSSEREALPLCSRPHPLYLHDDADGTRRYFIRLDDPLDRISAVDAGVSPRSTSAAVRTSSVR